MNKVTFLLVLFLTTGLGRSAESVPRDWLTELVNTREKLVNEFSTHPVSSINDADLYLEAITRLDAAVAVLRDDPMRKDAGQMFAVCSLYVTVARVQLDVRLADQGIAVLCSRQDSVLSELNRVHQKITEVERGHGTRLQADLAREKQDALRREEAAAARMRLLAEEAEAARAEADRIRAQAQERFQALQSELIKVSRDARGTIISMSDILFAVDSADLTADLQTNLAKIAGILMVYKTPRVVVEGHTDNTGTASYNQKLSERRAANVMEFLSAQGVDAARLSAVGYGLTRPVADNTTEEGRRKNRRVDLVIQDASAAPSDTGVTE